MEDQKLQQQIARIRATGATYEEALRRIAFCRVMQDRYNKAHKTISLKPPNSRK